MAKANRNQMKVDRVQRSLNSSEVVDESGCHEIDVTWSYPAEPGNLSGKVREVNWGTKLGCKARSGSNAINNQRFEVQKQSA